MTSHMISCLRSITRNTVGVGERTVTYSGSSFCSTVARYRAFSERAPGTPAPIYWQKMFANVKDNLHFIKNMKCFTFYTPNLCNNLPFEKGVALYFKKLNPLHPRMLCAKFGWNWHSGSWEEDENVKSLETDYRRSEKLTWAFSSGELNKTVAFFENRVRVHRK